MPRLEGAGHWWLCYEDSRSGGIAMRKMGGSREDVEKNAKALADTLFTKVDVYPGESHPNILNVIKGLRRPPPLQPL